MNNFGIDSHKLIYHVDRVHDWMEDGDTNPIFIEISPSGVCNHRCVFCSFDYLGYSGPKINTTYLLAFLSEAVKFGLKSVTYAGEGEPLLHPDIVEIISKTKKLGIDVALSTNGALFNEHIARRLLDSLTWIRFSVDAATKKTHSAVHRCNEQDFGQVINNITNAAFIKAQNGYECTIGAQFILLPENAHETYEFAKMVKDIGVDYLTVKPFYRRPMSHQSPDSDFHYTDYKFLEAPLQKLASDHFKVAFRSHAMEKTEETEAEYERCLGLPFASYIDANGDVYTCTAFVGLEDFRYGNIENSFFDIWESERREAVLKRVSEMDISKCHVNCRMDEINKYLWRLRNPELVNHLNFI